MREALLGAVASLPADVDRPPARRSGPGVARGAESPPPSTPPARATPAAPGGAPSGSRITEGRKTPRVEPSTSGPPPARPSDPRLTGGRKTPRAERSTSGPPAATWAPAVLERAERDLAPHIGPLARVIVRRACNRAHDVEELYALLALEIPSEAERERFKRRVPRER
jgi:serine/threonine-protein kinase